jgi:hypothetical protein
MKPPALAGGAFTWEIGDVDRARAMAAKLTERALQELKRLGDLLQTDFPRPIIPCLGWHLDESYLDEDGNRIHLGPGFGVGCFFVGDDHGSWERIRQFGFDFLLLLPLAQDAENTVIDFEGDKFFSI